MFGAGGFPSPGRPDKRQHLAEDFTTGEPIEVQLDPRLTPAQNAQNYYTEYRKLDTAEKKLTELIASGKQELVYIDSVFDAVSRTDSEADLAEIRRELREQGYLKGGVRADEKVKKTSEPLHIRRHTHPGGTAQPPERPADAENREGH